MRSCQLVAEPIIFDLVCYFATTGVKTFFTLLAAPTVLVLELYSYELGAGGNTDQTQAKLAAPQNTMQEQQTATKRAIEQQSTRVLDELKTINNLLIERQDQSSTIPLSKVTTEAWRDVLSSAKLAVRIVPYKRLSCKAKKEAPAFEWADTAERAQADRYGFHIPFAMCCCLQPVLHVRAALDSVLVMQVHCVPEGHSFSRGETCGMGRCSQAPSAPQL